MLSSLQLEAFHTLGQTRNFSKAARRLHISQSAFSQRVINLERELGTTLLIRDRADIKLTEAGERLLRHCEVRGNLEAEFLRSLIPSCGDELSGVIRVGGFSSVMRSLVLPALAPLMRKHPDLSIITFSAELDEILDLLKSARADVVLSNRDPGREGVVPKFLGYEENVLVRSRRFPEADAYLDHDERDVTTSSYFRLLHDRPKSVRKRYLDDVYGLIDGVRLGYGKAVLPRHLISGLMDLEVLHPNTRLMVPVYLLHFEQPFYTRVQEALVAALLKHFEERLPRRR